MVNETTVSKLISMKLSVMAEQFREQLQQPSFNTLSFEERLGLLVDAEWIRRKNNHLDKLIKKATLRYPHACVEDIEYHADRRLDQAQILRLSTGTFVHEKHNVVLMGASGAGKTYIGCALGMSACRQFLATKYIRLPELLTDLAVARGEGTYKKVIAQYKKISLLILDEWLLVSLTATESRDLLEIIEARHQNVSTIFISQFAPEGWHEKISEQTMADAILDRIVHNSHHILIDGEDSMRKRKGISS